MAKPADANSRVESGRGALRWREPLSFTALAAVTLAVYVPARHFAFIAWDDPAYVSNNPHVSRGLTAEGVTWALSTGHCSNWHPLTWISHMLDCQVYGLDPGWHHVTNVLIHVANALLVFLSLRSMTGAPCRSGLVASLFALHPLHVESVAWVAERKDVLSTLFGLLALWAWASYARGPSPGRYLASLGFFAAGLMAKPMLVTLPCLLLLLDLWPLGRFAEAARPEAAGELEAVVPGERGLSGRARATLQKHRQQWNRLVVEKVPFLLLAALSSTVTFLVQSSGGAAQSFQKLPLGARLANALVAYVRYLGKTVWPSDLSVFYPYRAWPAGAVIIAGTSLLAVTVVALRETGRRPWFIVGWLWYLGTLVPVIGLVQVGRQPMADRYTYLPLIGVFIVLVWGAEDLVSRWRVPFAARTAAAAAVLTTLAIACTLQVRIWANTKTLFTHALAVTENNEIANDMVGWTLSQEGRDREAIAYYENAVRIKPSFSRAHENLALALARLGRFDGAAEHLRTAMSIRPGDAELHKNLGGVLEHLGRMDEAETEFRQAVLLGPEDAQARNGLGTALARRGLMQDASRHFAAAIKLQPDYPEALNNLGACMVTLGNMAEALRYYSDAVRLKPDYTDAQINLAGLLLAQDRPGEAAAHFREALRLRPGDVAVRDALRRALAADERSPRRLDP